MVAYSLLSSYLFSPGLELQSPAPSSSSQLVRRRELFVRPVTISAPPTFVERTRILAAEMLPSSTNKSGIEPRAPEDTKYVLCALPILRKARRIKDVTKAVEEVAELVEKAAEVTEKVAEQIAEALPEGSVKEAAVKLEKIALLVDKEAEFTESITDMVDEVVEVMDSNLKLVEGEIKKNEEEDKVTLKKTVEDQSKGALQ